MKKVDPEQAAREFLARATDFQLGVLPTESSHPATVGLDRLVRENPCQALARLKSVDLAALGCLREKIAGVEELRAEMADTLGGGGRIFLCGCGATGRLALTLEFLWRGRHRGSQRARRVISFMAGGDLALVHSIEGFEDHAEYGARQLLELGYGRKDLLIAFTEGGETPFVIGATQAATRGDRPPFFLFCNPAELLRKHVARSRRLLESPRVRPLELCVGPMSLSGSTRLQATTVQMLLAGMALLGSPGRDGAAREVERFQRLVEGTDFTPLVEFAKRESEIYQAGDCVLYQTHQYGITILTDTTERAPTFSLVPFENSRDGTSPPSLCYLSLPHCSDTRQAWEGLLRREPRALEWPSIREETGMSRLYGFDFSAGALEGRRRRLPGAAHHRFEIRQHPRGITFRLQELRHLFPIDPGEPELHRHLLLKLLLNNLSTLTMGWMGRYRSNVMTWVRPSNGKLIDRAIRYAQQLLEEGGAEKSRDYSEVARQLFQEMARAGADESVVMRTVRALGGSAGGGDDKAGACNSPPLA